MATKKYNPYNSMRKIVDLKGSYDSAKWQGGNYQQHQNEAVQYYNDLINNGYAQQAADLSKYGYEDALDYINNSGWKSDEETEFDEWYDNLGKIASGDKRTVSEQQTDYIDKLMGIGTGQTSVMNGQYSAWLDDLMGVSTGSNTGKTTGQLSGWLDDMADLSTGKTSPQTSDAVSKLMDSWFANNQTHTDLVTDYHQTGKNQLDYLNNFDYTQQSYFKPIMDSYKLQGGDAANGALASGASANAGNIDSYAAANANRQQLAFTNAGHQAALAAAMQNQTNWRDIYNLMGGNVANYGNTNAQNLGNIANMYSTDAQERQNAANALYGVYNNAYNTDATERAKAMDVITQLFGQESVERQAANDVIRQLFGDESAERTNATNAMVDKYLADLGLVQSQYVTDAEERMNTANNEYGLALQQLANESGLSVAQIQAAVDREKAQLVYASDLANYGTQERINTANNSAQMERLKEENALQKALTAANNSAVLTQKQAEHKNAIDKIFAENGLIRDTTYSAEQVAADVYNELLTGNEAFSSIKTWDDLYSYVLSVSGDPTGAKKAVDAIAERNPKLLGGSSGATGQTFDYSGTLEK